ncbi:CHAT domain-containing protein [Lentimicrobium sp. L6]|uniref:CHAT domain-containing protein n=1 Tax=Lentimicrobium sp. L6 TaxID=2735916 RepID=UPI0015530E8E|nr:CHAT domain-containing protein [Lentimicrobium sp. L6]NPD85926.1 CHAT domain-containing protein [Lentimicrobium sp. L6]
MRYFIVLIFIHLVFFNVFGQLSPKQRNSKNNPLTNNIDELHLHLADSIILNNANYKSNIINYLNSIDKYNVNDYRTHIETIYNRFAISNHSDRHLLTKATQLKALLSYYDRNYIQAISEFKDYFHLYKEYYKNDTSFAYEYSKYTNCYRKTNRMKAYFAYIDTGLQIANKKKYPGSDQAQFYYMLSIHYSSNRINDSSRFYLKKAIRGFDDSKKDDYRIKYMVYKQIAYAELYSDNLDLAESYFNIAEEFLLKFDHKETELALLLRDKSSTLMLSNQYTQAIKQLKMALHIYSSDSHSSRATKANINRYIGLSYKGLGKMKIAIQYYKESLSLYPESKNMAYRDLADVFFSLEQNHIADSLYQISLDYYLSLNDPQAFQLSQTYYVYGQFLIEQKEDVSRGEEYLKNAITNWYQQYNGPSFYLSAPLNILGAHYLEIGEINQGLDSLQSSLCSSSDRFSNYDIYVNPRADEIPNTPDFNNALAWKAYGLYLLYLKTNDITDLEMSFDTYKLYIYCVNELRRNYDQIESLQSSKQNHYVYNQAIDVGYILYSKTNDANVISEIFNFIEGKKSFTLYQSLNILEKKKLLKVPKHLIKKELDLKSQMGRIEEEIKVEISLNNEPKTIKELDQKAYQISLSLDSIQKEYKENYSSFYNLKYGFKELSMCDIQKKAPANTAFINYSISDSLLNIITLSHEEVKLYTERIDSSFFQNIENVVKLLKKVDTDNSYEEFVTFTKSSRSLYQKLIKPIEKQIENKDLIFIPDGQLSYISFDVLLTEDVKTERPDYRTLPYLIKKHKSNVANSMQIYFNMRSRETKPNDKVYAFAPLYQNNKKQDSVPEEYNFLRPLDYAKMEVESIERNLKTKTFIGSEASEEIFKTEAKNAGILHLAMHTQINDEDPLYSKLLFTYNQETNSGLVNTYELLGLDLNAELAVLSGCSTGDGALQKGEGVMSLSSGFQFAGVPAIIMSLWEVNDRFGALVIDKFYQYLANGDKKSQALYRAKVEVLAQGNALYAHPYYWAGLTLMGDDAKLQFVQRKRWDMIILGSTILLALGVFIFQRRKKWAA